MRSRSSKTALERSSNKIVPVPRPRLNLWHGVFFLLGGLVAVGLAFLVPSAGHGSLADKSVNPPPRLASVPSWGDVDYTTIDLERPDESFPEQVPQPPPIVWWFPNASQPQVEGLLRQSQLSPEHLQILTDQSRWKALSNGWQILPPVEVVRDLSLPARETIYAALRDTPQNVYIQNPVHISADKFDSWLKDSGLTKENQELVRKMSIPEGQMVNFYDSQVIEWVCSQAEKKKFAKAITQTPALLMRLRIGPETDVDALVNYWGRGSRARLMKPFLESLTRVSGGTTISASFLFPAFARMRLYTYPDIRNDRLVYHEDCFWTSMNFFNETPDYKYFNADQIQATLKTDYSEVATNWTFGDLIMLVDNRKQAIHMCVYIADEVVFTKNGATFLAPWVLMKVPEMMKHYSDRPVKMVVFRKKVV